MKIKILIPYFGDRPQWLPYFLKTCGANPEINWLIYSDIPLPYHIPENVQFIGASMEDFSHLASEKLQLEINILNPYKICDLRPAFGKIFEDYLDGVDFWGYSDIDLFYGKLDHFITEDLLDDYDIISVRKSYFAGHLAFYRNNEKVNNLFKMGCRYKKIFQDPNKYFSFDERLNFIGKALNSKSNYSKIITGLRSIVLRFNNHLLKWFPTCPKDMTEIANRAAMKGHIRYFAEDMVRSDLWFSKKNMLDWEISWENGMLFDQYNREELLHFHIISSKHNREFKIDNWVEESTFKITRHGIFQYG